MTLSEITGTYGRSKNPITVFVAAKRNGLNWYVCKGSLNVNATYDEIGEDCDIEELLDVDCFTVRNPIQSLEELETAINS